jgi:putative CocE/NonD family hydrolase
VARRQPKTFVLPVSAAVLWAVAASAPLCGQTPPPEVRRDVMVAMRDGTRLACDLYLPADAAGRRYPTLVSRTPYNKAGLRGDAEWLAAHGYAVVAQDVRGRFRSEGSFYPFTQEGPDGHDTIEWAAAQEWSNGKVGTFGASYLAWDQYRAAMERPPHLQAMFANVGGADFYREYAYPGGAMNPAWGIWIVRSAESSPAADANPEAKKALSAILANPEAWLRLPPRERAGVFAPFPAHARIYQDFLDHPLFDRYWHDPAFYIPGGWSRMKDVPTLFISGWYDYFAPGVLDNFAHLSRAQRSPHRLIMGPWWHAIGGPSCGDGYFGEDAAVAVRELMLAWFDQWLKGTPPSLAEQARVRYFRMGGGISAAPQGRRAVGGAWRTASAWPLPNARRTRFYAAPGGRLQSKPTPAEPRTFEFDPRRPVPTVGGRYGVGSWTPNCFQNQVCRPGILGCDHGQPLASREDVLVFQSAPLDVPLEVTGTVRAKLWVSSDAPDTDFTAKLVSVAPDGYAAILADGRLRLRHHRGFEREELVRPGVVAQITIDLGPTSYLFSPGERIRLDLSSSNWPQFEPNANTGGPVNAGGPARKARNTIYLDPKRPSHVELPVVPLR